jgi:hypothetical protein
MAAKRGKYKDTESSVHGVLLVAMFISGRAGVNLFAGWEA